MTTYYYWGIGEKVSGSWTKFYVSGLGGKLVEYTSTTTQFFVTNHLGSVAARMTMSGTLSEAYRFLPFGERYAGTATTHQFTGKERDNESGLDYFGARYLASNHGRWMSVDPVLGSVANPQRLNRFSYVLNDPVNYVDRDGLTPELLICEEGPAVTLERSIEMGLVLVVHRITESNCSRRPEEGTTERSSTRTESEPRYQDIGPLDVSDIPASIVDGIQLAESILLAKPNCASMFGEGAQGRLSELMFSGNIRVINRGMPEEVNGQRRNQFAFTVSAIPRVYINQFGGYLNPHSAFYRKESGQIGTFSPLNDFNTSFSGTLTGSVTADIFRAFVMLHELGHAQTVFKPDGPTVEGGDEINRKQSEEVIRNCINP